jgi:hypothetical protein
MKKFWVVFSLINEGKLTRFDSKQEAQEEAARRAHNDTSGNAVYILEAVCVAQRPIPNIEMKDL